MHLHTQAETHLKEKLLPFWQNLRDDVYGGYIGYVGYDLAVDRLAPKGCILNSRILWFFSRAYQATSDAAVLEHARHAYQFLSRFWDADNGGVYWSCAYDGTPLDTMKHTYAQAFAIYGLCAYAMATGEAEPLARAMALYTLVETRMADGPTYLEAFDRTFHPLDNAKLSDNPKLLAKGIVAEKTMNTLLHVLEAYTLLHEATGDAHVAERLRALLQITERQVYNQQENRLEVFFDLQGRSVIDMQSYGHDIEASWLVDLAAARVLTGDALAHVQAWTTRLAQGVVARAYQGSSLLNEIVEGEVDPTRIWWVQAETMVGLANLWRKTGEAHLQAKMDALWQYIGAHFADPRPGSEWFWSLDAQGNPAQKPIVEPWKCPYHNGRMCLELMARL